MLNTFQKNSKWIEFYTLVIANTFSLVGNSISVIAIPWFVFDLTQSALTTAGVVLVGQLPNILVDIFSGPLIDKYSASRISYICDAINAIAIILIPIFYSLALLDTLLLTILVFLSMIFDVPSQTAKHVMFANLITKHQLPREKANGIVSMSETISDLCGPIIAGLLLTIFSTIYLLYIDSLTFVIAALAVVLITKINQLNNTESVQSIQFKSTDTWQWFFTHKLILKLAVFDLVINAIAVSLVSLVLPIIAKTLGDQALWLGVWLAVFAAGTSLTTVAYTLFGHKFSNLQLLKFTPLVQSAALVIIGLSITSLNSQWIVCIGLFIYGMALGMGSLIDASMLQKLVPSGRQGTIFALFNSLRYSAVPLGIIFSGWLLEQALYSGLFLIFAVLTLFSAIIWFFGDNTQTQY